MRIAEIFLSFDGEVNFWGQGTPSVFVRMAGCPLSCNYCDTKQWKSLQSGTNVSIPEVIKEVVKLEKAFLSDAKFKKVTITGGEPLLQYFQFWELVKKLDQLQWNISVETNGSMPLLPLDGNPDSSEVDCWVVDYKLPSSGMMEYMMPIECFGILTRKDFVKFIIQNPEDLKTAFKIQQSIQDNTKCQARFAYSPVWDKVNIRELAENLRQSHPEILGNCILNYQLHKLWGDPSKEIEKK